MKLNCLLFSFLLCLSSCLFSIAQKNSKTDTTGNYKKPLQYHARAIMDKLYNATEDGYPGDEDQGQTSSWYVLSALGFYGVCPGTDQYVLGSPVFKKVTVTLEDGCKLIIQADDNSKENVYIQSGSLNGKPYNHNWITYRDIVNGGLLQFNMGDTPALTRGLADEDKPFSI